MHLQQSGADVNCLVQPFFYVLSLAKDRLDRFNLIKRFMDHLRMDLLEFANKTDRTAAETLAYDHIRQLRADFEDEFADYNEANPGSPMVFEEPDFGDLADDL